jgi:chromosome segregation ATPase
MSDDPTKELPADGNSDETRLQRIEEQLGQLVTAVKSIDARLQKTEKENEARQYDTKPIWERALNEIAETRAEMLKRFGELDSRVGGLESEMRNRFDALSKELRGMNYTMRALNTSMLSVQGRYEEVDERLAKLESPSP